MYMAYQWRENYVARAAGRILLTTLYGNQPVADRRALPRFEGESTIASYSVSNFMQVEIYEHYMHMIFNDNWQMKLDFMKVYSNYKLRYVPGEDPGRQTRQCPHCPLQPFH